MNNVIRPQFTPSASAPGTRSKRKLEPGTWFAGPAQAIGDKRLKPRHWRVLSALCFHADTDGYCWPSQETICDMTDLSRRFVGEAIKDLVKLGYLKIGKKQRRRSGRFPGNTYKVIRCKPCTMPPF